MSSSVVRVLAQFQVKNECIDEFREKAVEKLVKPTQSEEGCLLYDLWQDSADPTQFFMVESWESEAALVKHLSQPALQQAVGDMQHMAQAPVQVRRLTSIR